MLHNESDALVTEYQRSIITLTNNINGNLIEGLFSGYRLSAEEQIVITLIMTANHDYFKCFPLFFKCHGVGLPNRNIAINIYHYLHGYDTMLPNATKKFLVYQARYLLDKQRIPSYLLSLHPVLFNDRFRINDSGLTNFFQTKMRETVPATTLSTAILDAEQLQLQPKITRYFALKDMTRLEQSFVLARCSCIRTLPLSALFANLGVLFTLAALVLLSIVYMGYYMNFYVHAQNNEDCMSYYNGLDFMFDASGSSCSLATNAFPVANLSFVAKLTQANWNIVANATANQLCHITRSTPATNFAYLNPENEDQIYPIISAIQYMSLDIYTRVCPIIFSSIIDSWSVIELLQDRASLLSIGNIHAAVNEILADPVCRFDFDAFGRRSSSSCVVTGKREERHDYGGGWVYTKYSVCNDAEYFNQHCGSATSDDMITKCRKILDRYHLGFKQPKQLFPGDFGEQLCHGYAGAGIIALFITALLAFVILITTMVSHTRFKCREHNEWKQEIKPYHDFYQFLQWIQEHTRSMLPAARSTRSRSNNQRRSFFTRSENGQRLSLLDHAHSVNDTYGSSNAACEMV